MGFEVGPRIGVAMRGHAYARPRLALGRRTGPRRAAAAAKRRALDASGIEDALGIAATQASGLMSAQFDSMVKRMNHAFGRG